MDEEQRKITENFATNLKADEYLKQMTSVWENLPEVFRFMMMFINDIFHSERFQGSKLLEIGSGAMVHSIAAASSHFSNITMSDYVTDNVENLKLWLKGESKLKQLLEIQAGLEGYGNDIETGVKILESRIRDRVKCVTRCDVLSDGVLLDTTSDAETSPPFDMVVSCLCLETAPKDFNGYVLSLKRINKLLRPGGGLLLCGFLNGSNWKVGEKEFHHIQFDEIELMHALSEAGFDKIIIKTESGGKRLSSFSYDKLYCANAEKF